VRLPYRPDGRNESPAGANEQLAVTETVAERDRRVEAAVARALAAQAPAPVAVSDVDAARALDVSTQTMARLARDGAPHLVIGDRRRWRMDCLLAWLSDRTHATREDD
jgi:hypothetical protein